jgi:hypothetical protein
MPPGYGVPATSKGMLSWDWVNERMTEALIYWIGTVHPDQRPHLMPNWGAWLDNYLVFGTDPTTRKARNLEAIPKISVAMQEGQHAVIIEGEIALTSNKDVLARMDDEYQRKYGMREGAASAYVVIPHKVIALGGFPKTPTRWVFETT